MKALRFHEYGGPEVLRVEDAPIPEPGEGQIQVKVAGAGVNPVDWKIWGGHVQAYFPVEFPAIVGREFSGTVSKLGTGVTDFEIGDEVYGIATESMAEYVVAMTSATARKPVSMDLPDAAAVPLAAMTAWQALFDAADLRSGQRVLIQAASGGVGTFAVQLAKWKGAYVIGTASAKNHHLLQQLGADELIDYRTTDYSQAVKDVDVVLEGVGGEENMRKSLSVLKKGGILVSITSAEPTEAAEAQGKRAVYRFMQPDSAQLSQIAYLIQDLKVRPIISSVVPFREAIEAQMESQSGRVVGKLVVDVTR
ncbi:MAG: NADP-dependent oxidoreductase [Fimbriimonas sp.]|nr:NADP-dependent oxidoreductase [Fimbriimonas sp.]